MIDSAGQSQGLMDQHRRATLVRRSVVLAAVVALAIALWGGYGSHWAWTGINGHTATLWDWLHLLLLPIAVGILPLWLSRRTRLPRRHKLLGVALSFAFALLVLAGYTIPWAWTGFVGNRLWDWLELLVLPLAVALTPVMFELRGNWTARYSLVAVAALAAFAVVVLGGYLGGWAWTGFRGNTFWDWLHLWLLPLLIPALVVPALRPRAMSGVVVLDEGEQAKSQVHGTASRGETH